MRAEGCGSESQSGQTEFHDLWTRTRDSIIHLQIGKGFCNKDMCTRRKQFLRDQ